MIKQYFSTDDRIMAKKQGMNPQERMEVLFDEFASRMSMYKVDTCLKEDAKKYQLLIAPSEYGFKVWVNKIRDHEPVWIEVLVSVAKGSPREVCGMGVQPVTARSVLLAGKDEDFGFRLSNALSNAFGIQVARELFNA
jgi:hypothetical protein